MKSAENVYIRESRRHVYKLVTLTFQKGCKRHFKNYHHILETSCAVTNLTIKLKLSINTIGDMCKVLDDKKVADVIGTLIYL